MSRWSPAPALALILLVSPASRATTMLAFDTPALFAKSRVVAVVEVVSLEVKRFGPRVATFADVVVSRPVKGTKAGERLRVLVPGGSLGEWAQQVEGAPELAVGERCVVFLEPGPGRLLQFVGLEQGRLKIEADPQVPGGFRVERSHSAQLVQPGTLAPAKPLPEREPLVPLLESLDRLPGAGR